MDDELRRLFEQFAHVESESAASAGCTVPLDVLETARGIEVVMDLVGVRADAINVVVASNTLLVTGHKPPLQCEHHGEAAFHVAERVFGHFARAVRLAGAYNVGEATATLRNGELRITLPRIEERRGREQRIRID